jgi:GNAT superfamily N-acetyltransferase
VRGLVEVDPGTVDVLFGPERPGPLLHAHVRASGVGRCWADSRLDPTTAVAELPGDNIALRGIPRELPDLAGFVEAPPVWLPVLRAVDPATAVWQRVIAVLPAAVDVPPPGVGARRLTAADTAALAEVDPSIAWIGETWDGPAGLARSGVAWGAFDGPRLVSVACAFFVGRRFEDIGVVTEPAYRGRGLSTACAAGVVRDIRDRGRQPTWTTSPDNVGSRRVAEHLGFVHARDDVLYAVRTPIPTPD